MPVETWFRSLALPARALLGRRRAFALYEAWQRSSGYPAAATLFRENTGRALNLRNPGTFNDKIMWLKLHDRNPLLPIVTNKVTARKWIADRVGEDKLVPLVGIHESASAIRREDLPDQFIAKLSTGTGRNIIVRDKNALDWESFIAQLRQWSREPQAYKLMEWYHHQATPHIVIENLMLEPDGQVPGDYKFYVFDGRVELLYHVGGRYTEQTRTFYSLDWSPLPVQYDRHPFRPTLQPPCLDQMIEIAETLGRGFPFMRIDTYCHQGRVHVGEMTPHPNSGMCRFNPSSFDLELGKNLKLDRYRGRYWESRDE